MAATETFHLGSVLERFSMTYRIPGGFGLVTFVHTLTGDPEPIVCTIGAGPTIPDEIAAGAIVDGFRNAWATHMVPNFPNSYQLTRTEMRYHIDTDDDDAPFSVVVNNTTATGGSAGQAVPQNVATLVHKRTALAGRQFRGRMFLPPPGEADVDAVGQLATAHRSALNADLAAFLVEIRGTGGLTYPDDTDVYLFHTLPDGELLAPLPTIITTLDVDLRVATQRTRLRR